MLSKNASACWLQNRSRTRRRSADARGQLKEAAKNGEDVDALRLELQQDYEDTLVNPYVAAERGYIDAVIRPSETRRRLNSALDMLATKRDKNPAKKHGNIPL